MLVFGGVGKWNKVKRTKCFGMDLPIVRMANRFQLTSLRKNTIFVKIIVFQHVFSMQHFFERKKQVDFKCARIGFAPPDIVVHLVKAMCSEQLHMFCPAEGS